METYWVWEYGLFEKNPKRQDSLNPETTLEVVKVADAQATIAALQAEMKGYQTKTYCAFCGQTYDIDTGAELIARHIKECPKHPMRDVESQLTQRTAELEAAKRKVDLAGKKAWLAAHDVGFFSMWNGTDHSGPPKLALLCNDTFAWATSDAEDVLDEQIDTIVELFKSEGEAGVIKWIAQQRNMKPMESVGKWLFGCDAIKKERDDLRAELERVRGELAAMRQRKDGAYLERNRVVAALASCFPSGIARTAIEGWDEEWHGCVYIDLPVGQVSWHYHDSHAHVFAHLPPYIKPWDGHTTEEKYERVALLKHRQGMEG